MLLSRGKTELRWHNVHNVQNVQNVQNMQNMQNVQNAHTGTEYRVSEHREPGDRAGIPTGKKVPPPGTRRPLWNFPLKLT